MRLSTVSGSILPLLALSAAALLALPAGAQPDAAADEAAGDTPVLRRGLRELDWSTGYGFKLNFAQFSDRTDAPFATVMARLGRFQTRRRELLWEIPVSVFHKPETAFSIGGSAILRQHFADSGRFIPFAEIGAGGLLTDISIRELGGPFQFVLQGGLGFRYAFDARRNFVLTARWYHLSNAGYREPNTGLNNGLVTVGYSVLY